jgi:RNA polymerase sigma-70 factor (ECF subfamily)
MKKNHDLPNLVSRAQKGDRESLGVLSAQVRRRVFVYLYRMTLDYHLAQDLAQETVLYMIESLPRLKTTSSSSLWAWIYRSAWGKLKHHLRPQGHQRIVQKTIVDCEVLVKLTAETEENVLEQAERSELCEAICKSLSALETKHRNVLSLRCFERLSYAEIASVMGSSELRTRCLFFRAKHALKRHLHNRGFGRKYFLTGLSLFGLITGIQTKSASAAVTVTSSLLETGTTAAMIGAVTTKLGLIAAATVAIGLATGLFHICNSTAKITADSVNRTTSALQKDAQWAFPSKIIDSEGDSWENLYPGDGNESPLRAPVDLQSIITEKWNNCSLILPEGHWIEFGFEKAVADGIGYDIRYKCLDTGNFPYVFLVGSKGRILQLINPVIEPLENRSGLNVSFDITNIKLPFEPVGIRLQGRGIEGQRRAPVLLSLEAQILP